MEMLGGWVLDNEEGVAVVDHSWRGSASRASMLFEAGSTDRASSSRRVAVGVKTSGSRLGGPELCV